jgi:Tol biopolymer transport system component
MKTKIVILPFLVVLIISMMAASCKKNSDSPDYLNGLGGKFVLTYNNPNNYTISVLNKSGETRIKYKEGSYAGPFMHCTAKWVQNGSRILVVDTWGWYIMNSDGSNTSEIHPLDMQIYHLDLSPDATKYVFNEYASDTMNICLMNHDLSNVVHVADGDYPSWSPDGSRIYYTSRKFAGPSLFYLDLADHAVHKLADLPSNGIFHSWSRNKTKILYTKQYEGGYFTMNIDGSMQQKVGDLNINNASFCCWSPDDLKLVFGTSSKGVCLMDPDGSNVVEIQVWASVDWYE